jgi:metal-responsive CopG/Arc/MetJ family transcriptional regulator
MKTIQMTLDDELVENVDKIVKKLHTNRSAFTREALQAALNKYNALQLEQQHYQGYRKHPVEDVEFSIWEEEQEWGDK